MSDGARIILPGVLRELADGLGGLDLLVGPDTAVHILPLVAGG
ncbi:MAG: hypothetical protein ACYDDU_08480 [Dermatophilaceae bacterium]